MLPANQIITESLILRVPNKGDGESLYEAVSEMISKLRSEPDTWTWSSNHQSIEASEEYCVRNYELWASGMKWPLLIIEKRSKKVLGMIEFYKRDFGWEVGAWSRPPRSIMKQSDFKLPSRGLMLEVVDAVTNYFIGYDRSTVVVMGIKSSNKAARRLVERGGCLWTGQYTNPERGNEVFEIYEGRYLEPG